MVLHNSIGVLMFGWELPPDNTGGLGVACQGLAKGLSRQGVNISFALPRPLGMSVDYMDVLDVNLPHVKVTAINSLLQSYMSQAEYLSLKASTDSTSMHVSDSLYQEAMEYAKVAKKLALNTPHQIIHTHDWMTFPAGMSASQASGKPWVAHVHATEFDRTGSIGDARISQIEYQGLQQADQVITVSQYTKNTIVKEYSINPQKINVVHNGIDLEDFQPSLVRQIFPHDRIVLYVGRLTFQKGVEYLIRSAKEVLATHPNTIFLIVGNGDMYRQHLLESASLGISDRIIFTGFLNGPKLRQVYQLADVFVMPSVSEPYGLVALEAIASSVPTIISKNSGVAETIKNVLTVDFWDIHKIARYITDIFDQPQEYERIAALAKSELNYLSWNNSAHKTVEVYRHVLA
jgi:glycosyltransferase involved in cell wall biosynthesis